MSRKIKKFTTLCYAFWTIENKNIVVLSCVTLAKMNHASARGYCRVSKNCFCGVCIRDKARYLMFMEQWTVISLLIIPGKQEFKYKDVHIINRRWKLDNLPPSIETHLAVVRGLPTKKFLPECVNEKSSTERRS